MNAFEKLVDRMGQALFRVETNFHTYHSSTIDGKVETLDRAMQAADAIQKDLENLKAVKAELTIGPVDDLAKACEMIMGVRYVMMFQHIHDEQSAREVLDKYGAANVQLLARKAQDLAEKALKAWEEANK